MSEKAETLLVRKCIAWLKANGGDGYHVHGSAAQRAGEPDINGEIRWPDGTVSHLKIECKVHHNQPSKLQAIRLATYSRYGYTVGVAYSLEQFIEIVEHGGKLPVE